MIEKRGLTHKEAREKLSELGYNEIKETNKLSIWKILVRQIKSNFVVYLLVFATIISFFVGKILTAYVLIGVVTIIISTGFVQEYRAEKAIKSLKEMMVPVSIVIRDGKEKEIPSREIVPGDVIILRNGERVPADCLILEEKDLKVNESILTGESKEIKKFAAKDERDYSDENIVFAGTFLVNGKCTAKAIHTGMNSRFGKIASMISTAEKELPLQKKVNKITKYMVVIGLIFSFLTGLIMLARSPVIDGETIALILVMIIAVAVSSFPEGFPVVLITALASGAYRMAKKNAIVNRMSIIETLGETTVICTDKTGTITKGEMTIKKFFTDNKVIDVEGAGYEAHGDFYIKGKKISVKGEESLKLLLKAGILCNDSKIEKAGDEKNFLINGNSTEVALLIAAAKAGIYKEDLKHDRIEELPFSSERKMMSVVCKENNEKIVYTKGALEFILPKCNLIQRNNGVFKMRKSDREKILLENAEMTKKAFRTIAIAYKKYNPNKKENIEENLIFIGLAAMEDPPRNEVKEAISLCRKAGIKVKMVTGDHRETAISIARQIELGEGKVVEGYEIDKMTDEELKESVNEIIVFARVRPEHKLRIVKALKEKGEIVTMTGDGVNDAPSLKEAHIGIAMGKTGTDVSRSVADLTLKDDNFATIVDAIKEGRSIYSNIQKFSAYQISINIAQVSLIFVAVLLNFPLPLIAIQILFINLFSDEITAITLAFNPYSKDIMENKPRKKSNILTIPIFVMMIFAAAIMCFGSLSLFYYALTHGMSETESRTVVLITMVMFAAANAYNFRSFRKPVIGRSIYVNKYLFYATIATIAGTFLVVYFEPFTKIFDTAYVDFYWWIYAALTSFSIILLFDIFKAINNKKNLIGKDLENFNIY